jgi:hypothetical protein
LGEETIMIIGVAGQLRQGKDVAADYIASKLGLGRGAFAAGVKQAFCEYFGVDMEFIERWKVIQEPPPGFKMNVRKALQFIGDGFRGIKEEVWIESLFRLCPRGVVISDVRYRNELASVRRRGGYNILMCRPGFLNDDPNGSESQIRTFVDHFMASGREGLVSHDGDFDLVDFFLVNDGTIDDLYAKIDDLVVPHLRPSRSPSCVV